MSSANLLRWYVRRLLSVTAGECKAYPQQGAVQVILGDINLRGGNLTLVAPFISCGEHLSSVLCMGKHP